MKDIECKHKWVFRESIYNSDCTTHVYSTKYIKIDYYYCEKCLEEKQKEKHEYCREMPIWFKG